MFTSSLTRSLTKKLAGVAVATVAVVGIGGVALAGNLPGAADPGPTATTSEAGGTAGSAAAGPIKGLKDLRACVDAGMAAGAERRDARRTCVGELRTARGGRVGALGLKGAVHAEVTIPVAGGTGYEIVQVDRGTVSAVDAGSITLHRADGVDVKVTLAPSTVYKGSATTASEVKVGVRAGVVAKDGTARVVLSGKAPKVAKTP